jgi:hypothetical protein
MDPEEGRATGSPEVIFTGGLQAGGWGVEYDITPDGTRFVVIATGASTDGSANEFVVVVNWMEEVRERLRD